MKDCLVSFSSKGRENYNDKLLRLLDSAIENWKGDYLIYSPDHELTEYKGIKINKGYPTPGQIPSFTHESMPYQFKIALIQQAKEMGYDRIIWLDSSMVIKKDITELFGETGISVFHNLGHPLYKYISDKATELLNIDENALIDIEQIWGGALLFDFTKQNATKVFEEICKYSCNGSFMEASSQRKGFIAHRHDQAIISVLVHEKCDMHPYGTIVCPPHDITLEYGNNFYLTCR
jgi:hypothetical protein